MPEHLPPGPDGSNPAVVPTRRNHLAVDVYGQYGSAGEGAGTDWRRYSGVLVRYKWMIAAATLLGIGGGAVAVKLRPPDYEAQAMVWAASSPVGPSPIESGQLLQGRIWIDLLQSYAVLDHAVRSLRLFVQYENPADSALFASFDLQSRFVPGQFVVEISERGDRITLSMRGGDIVEHAVVGDSIGRSVGFLWVPVGDLVRPGTRVSFAVANPRDVAREIGTALRVVTTDRTGSFLKVSLKGKNPVRVAATVNEVLSRFVQLAADLKRVQLTEKVGILREQLQNAERNLREAEQRLERFKVETITMPTERAMPIAPGLEMTQDPAMQSFFDMRIELEELRRDREAIERLMASAVAADWDPMGLELVGSVQRSTDLTLALSQLTEKRSALRALQTQYTDEHPQVRRLAGEIQRMKGRVIPELARTLIADLTIREAAVEDRLGSATNELQQIPPRKIEEDRLARDVVIAENLYTILQQRYEESRLAEVSSISDVSILDPAVTPQRPVSQGTERFLMMGVVAGFGLGLAGALLLDRLDRRVRYPEQVSEQMGLQILGVIPHLKGLRKGTRGMDGTGASAAPVVESLRGIRLNLVHAYGAAGPIVLTVTSPGSGDGKSFVSANLALAFADAGHRTLLIDADTRRGSLHRVLNAARKPGLTDLLASRVEIGRAIQETSYPMLHFMGSGTRVTAAPELLGSPEMSQLIVSLRTEYGVVLVDSPPLGAGVDAYALGTVTGNLLIVMRTGLTNRDAAEAKLDMLDRLPVRMIGAILNDAKDRQAYGYGYYSYYMPGYEHEHEEDAAAGSGLLESAD